MELHPITQKPWRVEKRAACQAIVDAEGMDITYIFEAGSVTARERTHEELDAIAALIAAGPELLGALKYITEWKADPTAWNPETARDMAKAAIAKATPAPRAKVNVWRNTAFIKRDPECTNLVACIADKAPGEKWAPADASALVGLERLWIEKGVEYYGHL